MSFQSRQRFSSIIAGMARPADVRALPIPAMHLVMAMRLFVLYELAGREPLVELTSRLGSVTVAELVLSLTRLVDRIWPDAFEVSRPCCFQLSPDERTLANLVRCVLAGDRRKFGAEIEGFVRAGRQAELHAAIAETVAGLSQLQQRA